MSETQGLIFVVLAAVFEMFITMIYCDSVLKDRREFLTPPLYLLVCVGLSALL